MPAKQRLIICLDGTWNTKDDSTNVLHHFAFVVDGAVSDGNGRVIIQKKEYIQGVGTGALDHITGGGFGIGLEQNVREAYNWLVQNFNDAPPGGEPDEIYIFGFSRGAYTARSLVGLIGSCGLLRRGAPITVNQIWQNYCILGRRREERSSIWDRVFPEPPPPCRPMNQLVRDSWHDYPFTPPELTERERLLVAWSRRVRITYLGVYDTVGAMGLDALAIPGLRSKVAMHHNLRPTSLIRLCRHALAMNEHRISFNHNPFIQFVGHPGENHPVSETDHIGADREKWRERIEQRWFVGAHSNIGGGYPDNELAQIPFRWLFEEAAKAETAPGRSTQCGLVSEKLPPFTPSPCPPIRDSYEEFAKPFWSMILRGKRHYRRISPKPEYRATYARNGDHHPLKSGFSLESINETVDRSVYDYWEKANGQPPPNLIEFAERQIEEKPADSNRGRLAALLKKTPHHAWLGDSPTAYAFLIAWSTAAAVGVQAMNEAIRSANQAPIPVWLLCIVALLLPMLDWLESRATFKIALKPFTPFYQALADSIYWTRSLGFILFMFGAISSVWWLLFLGWTAAAAEHPVGQLGHNLSNAFKYWSPVPIAATVGLLITSFFEKQLFKRPSVFVRGLLLGSITALASIALLPSAGWIAGRIFSPVITLTSDFYNYPPSDAEFAGLLFFLELSMLYLFRAILWIEEPLEKAHLGTMVQLQVCATPQRVMWRLERWRKMLSSMHPSARKTNYYNPQSHALRDILRQALYRDLIGLIPVYAFVMGFALWFASVYLEAPWTQKRLWIFPLWLILPLIPALLDATEDFIHLRYLRDHANGRLTLSYLPPLAFTITLIKSVALWFMIGVTLWISSDAIYTLALGNAKTGWRGVLALLIPAVVAGALLTLVIGAILYRINRPKENGKHGKESPRAAAES